jgi:hypothetical protein
VKIARRAKICERLARRSIAESLANENASAKPDPLPKQDNGRTTTLPKVRSVAVNSKKRWRLCKAITSVTRCRDAHALGTRSLVRPNVGLTGSEFQRMQTECKLRNGTRTDHELKTAARKANSAGGDRRPREELRGPLQVRR